MLVIKIEVWPGGDGSSAREIGRCNVGNVSGLAPKSDYTYAVKDGPRGTVLGHERDAGAWELVRRVAADAVRRGAQ